MSVTRGAAILVVHIAGSGLVGCGEPATACGAREAAVERVIDGDTIELAGGLHVRYLLVNAPETTGCYAANATRFNADLVLGKTVELEPDGPCLDAFGRALAYVTVDGRDVNRLLVERGYACVLHIPPGGDARSAEFKAVEAAARAAGRGLWGACAPVPCR